MDKFEKTSIYDIKINIEDVDGIEHEFIFKPLPWDTFPQVYGVLAKLSESGLLQEQSTEEVNVSDFLSKLDPEMIREVLAAEIIMVKNSYPELEDKKAENFVSSNMYDLLGAMIELTFKQEKTQPRKAQNGLQAKG